MKVGLVGFSGSGKTTVFNALTGLAAQVASHGRKDQANLGSIKVPDARIDRLASIYHPKRKVYAEVTFVDVAGQEVGENSRSLDAEIVRQMREADALVHVVRGFVNALDSRPPQPGEDIAAFESELILTDLVQVEARIGRLAKDRSASPQERNALEACQQHLGAEKPLRSLQLSPPEWGALAGFRFLSHKPILILINLPDSGLSQGAPAEAENAARERDLQVLALAGQVEMEIAQLDEGEQGPFLQELGIKEPARYRFIGAAYQLLDLISFLTAGEDECRAWPIKRGTTAHRAAGKIHSDIERGFIRAEVAHFENLIALGSEAKAREAGKLRLEGKEYVVRDGDVIHFRFNV